jgi:hypothetical protein
MIKLSPRLSRKRSLPWDVAERVAGIAKVPKEKRTDFCVSLCDRVRLVWERDKQTPPLKGKPGPILAKAAEAARTLNEAVCSLTHDDRLRVDKVVARDPWLSQEARLRGPAKLFETYELENTVCLLDQLFSIAIGKSPPMGAGGARLSKRRGKKKGNVRDAAFHDFVYGLLSVVAEFSGTLELDKNKNFHETGGPLADALTSLRPYAPDRVIPEGKLPLNTLQRLKAEHKRNQAKAARLEQNPEMMRDHLHRLLSR